MVVFACHSSCGLLALAAVCLISSGAAQFSFHTDANTNAFTLKTPSLQQSFTRYYGGIQQQQQQQLQQQQQSQQQLQQLQALQQQSPQQQLQQLQALQQQSPQQVQTSPFRSSNTHIQVQPQQYAYSQPLQQSQYASAAAPQATGYQQAAAQYAQTLQQLQALQRQQQQPQAQAQETQQQQYSEQLRSYYAQQQQQMFAQQQQQQLLKQLYQNQPVAQGVPDSLPQQDNQLFTAEQYAGYLQQQQQQPQQYYSSPTEPTHTSPFGTTGNQSNSTTAPRNGLQYSPSDQVSRVKFQSGSLAYNF